MEGEGMGQYVVTTQKAFLSKETTNES
jgi:hypothetical protein